MSDYVDIFKSHLVEKGFKLVEIDGSVKRHCCMEVREIRLDNDLYLNHFLNIFRSTRLVHSTF